VLVLEQVDFPRRHDLDALRKLLPEGWQIAPELADLARLTEWSVEARYPGDWSDASKSDAQQAVEQARAVCESVLARFATL
jgi:HEPN domain-containing protein